MCYRLRGNEVGYRLNLGAVMNQSRYSDLSHISRTMRARNNIAVYLYPLFLSGVYVV